jgi:uncharacterized protein (DUF2236 family)
MMREELVRTKSVERVLRAVRQVPPPLPVPAPIWRAIRLPAAEALRLGAIGLMRPELRARLGIDWSRRDEARFRLLGAMSRSLTPVLPRALTVTGPAQLRWRRQAIARGPLGAAC